LEGLQHEVLSPCFAHIGIRSSIIGIMVALKTVGTIFALLPPLLARRDLAGVAMDK
jgi:hypothetical protein